MAKESMLQKEFKERDVQRMRNLLTGKYSDTTGVQTGYKKSYIERNEGDIWEENGKTWTIKNGIKMTVSKLDEVKKIMQLPLVCPNCQKRMNKPSLDKKMYSIHKMCFDCVIEFETKLRQEGKYEEYESNMMNQNIFGYIDDLNQLFEEFINDANTNDDIVTEDGDIERWVGGNIDKEKIRNEFKEYIDNIKKLTAPK